MSRSNQPAASPMISAFEGLRMKNTSFDSV
jgi:hypothetical protein